MLKVEGKPEPEGPPEPHEIDCDCKESISFEPHPNSCEHYFICAFGESILLDCAPGFWFDPINFWCDNPEDVKCAANSTEPIEGPVSIGKRPELSLPPVILTPIFAP